MKTISGFICLRCTIVILSTFGSTSLEKPQTEYNYTFPVRVVANCPMNMSDWQAAAERTGCNDTNAYHCAPDRFHLKLVEFCYYKTPNHVREGNCLELISYGVLNHVKCNNFTWGCPEKPYLSNEIYVYPVCLSLVAGCFISDVQCLRQKFEEQQRQLTAPITTMELQCPFNVFIILFVFSLLALIFFQGSICGNIYRRRETTHLCHIDPQFNIHMRRLKIHKLKRCFLNQIPILMEIFHCQGHKVVAIQLMI